MGLKQYFVLSVMVFSLVLVSSSIMVHAVTDDRFEENDTPLQSYTIMNTTCADDYFEAKNSTHINRTWAFYTTILTYDGSADEDWFQIWISTNTTLIFKILAENTSMIMFDIKNASGALIVDGGSLWNEAIHCDGTFPKSQGWWKIHFTASKNVQYNFSVTLSNLLPKAGEGLPEYNGSSYIALAAGPGQTPSLQAGNVQMDFNISCLSNIELSLGAWDSNPFSAAPGFDNGSSALYFAIEVSNKSAVVYPVVVKIKLTDDLLAGLPSGLTNESAKTYFKFMRWNETANKWEDSGYTISVNLKEKIITISFQSFSIYSLGISTPPPKQKNPINIPGYPLIFITSLSVISLITLFIRNKRKYFKK